MKIKSITLFRPQPNACGDGSRPDCKCADGSRPKPPPRPTRPCGEPKCSGGVQPVCRVDNFFHSKCCILYPGNKIKIEKLFLNSFFFQHFFNKIIHFVFQVTLNCGTFDMNHFLEKFNGKSRTLR